MQNPITFHDHKPTDLRLYDAVVQGLSAPRKALSPKFFYDERGSQLFDAICDQPEYYLPDAERRLLNRISAELGELVGSGRVIIEPGAGSLAKVQLLLDVLRPSAYVPMDISSDYLREAAEDLSAAYPWLAIHATCVDFTHSLPVPDKVPEGPRLAFFPGSSLGNFHPHEALEFLRMIHDVLGPDGQLLIGVDTKKPAPVLHAAYNDAAGVTAEFNRNLLHRIQRELETDIKPETFEHHAFYNQDRGRVEMHLVSRIEQQIHVGEHRFHFKDGESLHTECSYKYSPDEFLDLATEARLRPVRHWLADDALFAVYLLQLA